MRTSVAKKSKRASRHWEKQRAAAKALVDHDTSCQVCRAAARREWRKEIRTVANLAEAFHAKDQVTYLASAASLRESDASEMLAFLNGKLNTLPA